MNGAGVLVDSNVLLDVFNYFQGLKIIAPS